MASIIKLQTNLPVTGVIESANFVPTKNPQYQDQIMVTGKWDGAGEGRIYLHLSIREQLTKLGVIGAPAPNGEYPVLLKEPRVKIVRVEQGTSKITTVELIGSAGSAPTQGQTKFEPSISTYSYKAPAITNVTEQDLDDTYEDCVKRVAKVWIEQGGKQDDLVEQIAAGAHTMFIQRCKLNLYTKSEQVPV